MHPKCWRGALKILTSSTLMDNHREPGANSTHYTSNRRGGLQARSLLIMVKWPKASLTGYLGLVSRWGAISKSVALSRPPVCSEPKYKHSVDYLKEEKTWLFCSFVCRRESPEKCPCLALPGALQGQGPWRVQNWFKGFLLCGQV